MPLSFAFAYAGPVAQRYRQRRAWKYLFLLLYGNTDNSLVTARAPKNRLITVKRLIGDYASFTQRFKRKDSVLNTSAINAITKSSTKPWSVATANRHLCGSGKVNQEQRWGLVEPWCEHWSCSGWWKGTSRDEATLNSEEIKPIALAVIELRLSEGIR